LTRRLFPGRWRHRVSQPMRRSLTSVCSWYIKRGIAYGYQMGLRPQTLYGIADSPVGLAAYFLDHDARSYELISRVCGRIQRPHERRHPRQHHDHLVDEHGAFWRPSSMPKASRSRLSVSVFPDEPYPAPRSSAERAYSELIHYNKLDKGGHFAGWEQPQLLSEEVRASFRSLRSGMSKSDVPFAKVG
jgi:hypothetical protein